MMTENKAKSIAINDAAGLRGGPSGFMAYRPNPEFVVEEHDGAFRVVVRYWNDDQRRFVPGSVVALDEKNQFQPVGMLLRFTLTDDGFLTWEETGT